MSVLDLVQQNLGPAEIQQLSEQLGADPSSTASAVQAALPMLLGGMASSARQPGGAQAIEGAMQEHASALGGLGGILGGAGGAGGALGGVLGGLADMIGGGGGGGGGLLDRVLGHQQTAVQDGVQQASGLDRSQVQRLLMMLAPIVLAALARRHQQQQTAAPTSADASADLNRNGIPDVLEQEAQQARASTSPHIGGIVGKILDAATRH
jgi:hypothetical protein